MNKTKITKTLMAVMVGSALLSGSALADESVSQKTQNKAASAGRS
ncbi:MAG TPA: molecular chaperone OsmY, partial [Erwiniaceae bacterium]|nr:molecular chaperone OsmY [Erwiniaceae bacterium]